MKYLALPILALLLTACSDDSPIPVEPQQPIEAPAIDSPAEYQQKIRTVPYPRSSNEIFINPAPLIVPQNMAKSSLLRPISPQTLQSPVNRRSGICSMHTGNCRQAVGIGAFVM